MSQIDSVLYPVIAHLIPTGEPLIFADQNAPRPALPYWTMRSGNQRKIGSDVYAQDVNDLGELVIRGTREVTVSVQRIGKGSPVAVSDLRDHMSRVTVREELQSVPLTLYNLGDVTNIPYEMDDNHLESRAALDFFIRFGVKIIDTVGIIEVVEIEAQYSKDGQTIDPDLTDTITVVL